MPRTHQNDVLKMMQTLSNWGRWGKDDQLGALNLITPQKRKEAAALVKEGLSISLARNAVKVRVGVSAPFEHRMVQTGLTPGSESSGDVYSVQFHGFTHTHLDALCHVFHQGRMYNGYSQEEVTELGSGEALRDRDQRWNSYPGRPDGFSPPFRGEVSEGRPRHLPGRH